MLQSPFRDLGLLNNLPMKTITTGTEITFTKTNDKFELIQNPTGFDVKQIKLSKNVPHEPYTFQELLDLYESGKITIEGFEEADAPLVKSILVNYIHTTEISDLKADITRITADKEVLEAAHQKLLPAYDELTITNEELTKANKELTAANEILSKENSEFIKSSTELSTANKELKAANKELEATNEKLNTTIAAMQEQE